MSLWANKEPDRMSFEVREQSLPMGYCMEGMQNVPLSPTRVPIPFRCTVEIETSTFLTFYLGTSPIISGQDRNRFHFSVINFCIGIAIFF